MRALMSRCAAIVCRSVIRGLFFLLLRFGVVGCCCGGVQLEGLSVSEHSQPAKVRYAVFGCVNPRVAVVVLVAQLISCTRVCLFRVVVLTDRLCAHTM